MPTRASSGHQAVFPLDLPSKALAFATAAQLERNLRIFKSEGRTLICYPRKQLIE
jgi:hypothetical protein